MNSLAWLRHWLNTFLPAPGLLEARSLRTPVSLPGIKLYFFGYCNVRCQILAWNRHQVRSYIFVCVSKENVQVTQQCGGFWRLPSRTIHGNSLQMSSPLIVVVLTFQYLTGLVKQVTAKVHLFTPVIPHLLCGFLNVVNHLFFQMWIRYKSGDPLSS